MWASLQQAVDQGNTPKAKSRIHDCKTANIKCYLMLRTECKTQSIQIDALTGFELLFNQK